MARAAYMAWRKARLASRHITSSLTKLTQDIFVGRVANQVRTDSPVAGVFRSDAGGYQIGGRAMRFETDFRFKPRFPW